MAARAPRSPAPGRSAAPPRAPGSAGRARTAPSPPSPPRCRSPPRSRRTSWGSLEGHAAVVGAGDDLEVRLGRSNLRRVVAVHGERLDLVEEVVLGFGPRAPQRRHLRVEPGEDRGPLGLTRGDEVGASEAQRTAILSRLDAEVTEIGREHGCTPVTSLSRMPPF